jgi:hypothetical protein
MEWQTVEEAKAKDRTEEETRANAVGIDRGARQKRPAATPRVIGSAPSRLPGCDG